MTGSRAHRDVAVARCVGTERTGADGCVGATSGVEDERITTLGGIANASCVAKKCRKTGGRVQVTGYVGLERKRACGRVVAASGVV